MHQRSKALILFVMALSLGLYAFSQSKAKGKAAAPKTTPKYKGIFEPVSIPEPINLESVWFIDDKTGWVSGDKGTIMKTTDAGETWTAQLGGDPAGTGEPVKHLFFLDDKHGWAAGNPSKVVQRKLLGTRDGETWREVGTVGTEMRSYVDFQFTSPTSGVFLEGGDGGAIYKTVDGGRNWKQVLPGCVGRVRVQGVNRNVACHFRDVDFTNEVLGHAVGASQGGVLFVWRTEDAGDTWKPLYISEAGFAHQDENSFMQKVYFLDENKGFVTVHRAVKLLATNDSGKTWEEIPDGVPGDIKFADEEVGWNVQFDYWRFSWTTNGGKTWTKREIRFPDYLYGYSVPSRQRAYVAGRSGLVFRYSVVPYSHVNKDGIETIALPGAKAE